MSGNDLNVDFFMRVPPERGGRNFLSSFSTPSHMEPSSGWERIARYCAEWAQPKSQLHDVVRHIWFEFDTAEKTRSFQLPSIVFWHPPATLAGAGKAQLQADVLDTSNRLLAERPISTQIRHCFLRSICELPGPAFVFCVGVMIDRPEKEFRLCLKGFTHSEVLPYLARIGWDGRIEVVREVLSAIGAYADTIQIILGIDESISTRLHLEFRCDELSGPGARARWLTLLDKLIAKGLATSDRAAELLGWPGFPFEQVNASLSENLYVRIIDHVKVVIDTDGSLRAKCYFGVWETIRVRESELLSPVTCGLS
jgi:hypothetical protein